MPGTARLALPLACLLLASATGGCQTAASPASTLPAPAQPTGSPIAVSPSPACATSTPPGPRPGWADRTFYEVFVRSFADADGDGIGDLAGLTSKLDYLNDGDPASDDDLGVSGIWLMPVAEAASYHGYDVTDYTAIEREYGDQAGLRSFVDAAHERGIFVIVDFVINHTSRDHPWFQDALAGGEHRDWYIWSETNPGWPPIAGPSPWHATPGGDFYYGAFWEGMPDLNLRNPDVTVELERVARVWLEDLGVDGFRIDAAKHLIEDGPEQQANTDSTRAWLADFTAKIHAIKPDALVLGEVFDSTLASSSYVPAVDTTFAFELAGRTLLAVQSHDGSVLRGAAQEAIDAYGGTLFSTFLTNHDQPRVATQLSSPEAGRVAATLLLTGPGVPFLYYGEEIGLPGGKPDERIRTPMPWTGDPEGAGFTTGTAWEELQPGWDTRNVAAEQAYPASLLGHYRSLVALRRDHAALRTMGGMAVETSDPAVIATVAWAGDDAILVVANLDLRDLSDVRLSLATGPCGLGEPAVAYLDRIAADAVELPTLTPAGGFEGWRPAAVLPSYSTIVVAFDEVSP